MENTKNRVIPMVLRFLNTAISMLDILSDRNCFSMFSLSLVLAGKKASVLLFWPKNYFAILSQNSLIKNIQHLACPGTPFDEAATYANKHHRWSLHWNSQGFWRSSTGLCPTLSTWLQRYVEVCGSWYRWVLQPLIFSDNNGKRFWSQVRCWFCLGKQNRPLNEQSRFPLSTLEAFLYIPQIPLPKVLSCG